MKEMSSLEKMNRPHSLFFDPQTGLAAAYSVNHRLVTENASKKLIAYAMDPKHSVVPFDATKHADGVPRWRPLPAWATHDVQSRLQLVRLDTRGIHTDDDWRTIPRR